MLPGWLRMFVEAIGQYHQYTQNQSVLVWLFGSIAGRILEVASVVVCALCIWPMRREPSTSAAFGRAFGLVLALTVVIVPMFALYNQVLLAPAILALLRSESSGRRILPAIRLARAVGGILLVWPWIATLGLSLAFVWLTPALRQRNLAAAVLFQLHAACVRLRIGAAGYLDEPSSSACGRARPQSSLFEQAKLLRARRLSSPEKASGAQIVTCRLSTIRHPWP